MTFPITMLFSSNRRFQRIVAAQQIQHVAANSSWDPITSNVKQAFDQAKKNFKNYPFAALLSSNRQFNRKIIHNFTKSQ